MKKINWKSLIITCIVTLIPMLIGAIFYSQLPEDIPVHFNINNQPDTYTSKEFALFGLPAIFVVAQIVCCVVWDSLQKEGKEPSGFSRSIKWWIPVISILVAILLVEYPLRVRLDIRMYMCILLGILAIITGYYYPKLSYEQAKGKVIPYPKNEKNFSLLTKVLGVTFIVFGIAIIVSIRFVPVVSVVMVAVWAVVTILESVILGYKK